MIARLISRAFSFILGNVKLMLIKITNFYSFKYYLSDRVSPFASLNILNGKMNIGRRCRIDFNTVISAVNGSVVIGDGCFINRNCQIVAHESIKIGNNVMIGPNVIILDHDHKIENRIIKKRQFVTKEIIIEEDAWIGANSVILKGVTIGKGSVVAAGAVVTHDCPAGSVIVQKKKTETLRIG